MRARTLAPAGASLGQRLLCPALERPGRELETLAEALRGTQPGGTSRLALSPETSSCAIGSSSEAVGEVGPVMGRLLARRQSHRLGRYFVESTKASEKGFSLLL